MPGLVGLISNMPRARAESELSRMLGALLHESFYVSGKWIDESMGLYVGWVARKGAFAEAMPLQNERRSTTLIFSGEEYPDPATLTALKERGHAIEPSGPSYLVHRYEDESDFPKQLNGRFHGLVADHARGTTMLFNDRFGLQRLYYHQAEDGFYFAAEAKAILNVRPELRRIEERGLGEFVSCGCVLENRTLFSGIYVLPAGSAWIFGNSVLQKKELYFDPQEWEQQGSLAPEEYYSQLRYAVVRNLPRYFNGSERVGVSLTGGLDTRIIMAWHKAQPNTLPCYTFGSMYRDNQDVKLARRVAKICGQSHQVLVTGEEFLSRFPHYAERTTYLTEGGVDLGRSPDLYVNEKAREIAPVRMVGTYGSEILLHAVMFKADEPVAGLFQPDVLQLVRTGKATYDATRRVHPVTFAAFRQSPWHHYGVLGLEQTQVAVRSPYLDNDLVKTVYRAPDSAGINEQARLRLIRDGSPELAKLPTDLGIGGSNNRLAQAYLKFSFKAEYAYDYGMPQWIAQVDHMFSALRLERVWLGRHKIFHFRVWYRDQLRGYVREMLLDNRSLSRPYLERAGVERIVNDHLRGNRNFTTEISRLLSLELIHRLFIDQN